MLPNLATLKKGDYLTVGIKASTLGELASLGFNVPSGFVLPVEVFHRFLDSNSLTDKIQSILDSLNYSDAYSLDVGSGKISELIYKGIFSPEVIENIQKDFNKLGQKVVAVRSSSTDEDATDASWAGMFQSFLNVTEGSLFESVKKCWASAYTSRALAYCHEHGLQRDRASMAVLVQEMVESKKSGVAFSVHPVTQERNHIIIEACFGLGDALASGKITPDSYIIEKDSRRIFSREIQSKNAVLLDSEIFELVELVTQIEEKLDFSCDVEWCFDGRRFFVVQSRPITNLEDEVVFKRHFQKFFSREIPLVVMQYWYRGESVELYKILERATHFNPLFLRRGNGLVDVYYDMNNPDTALQPLFDFLQVDIGNRFEGLIKEFEEKIDHIAVLLDGRDPKIIPELFGLTSEAWGYLPIWVQVSSSRSQNYSSGILRRARDLRDRFQEVEYKVGEVILAIVAERYPDVRRYLDVISIEEIVDDKIPSIAELKERANGFIFFEGRLIKNISKNQFAKDESVVFFDNLGTIGESGFSKEDKLLDESMDFLKGKTAFPGLVTGCVRVVLKKIQLMEVLHGEILVTPMTTPEFVSVFAKVKAVITDEGGITSHAAIISRELGIPCVIGTKYSTKILRTGDEVEVNADDGTIRVLRRA